MSKKIYYVRDGEIISKATVVYENKTYYYCKVNGTDSLEHYRKDRTKTMREGVLFPNGIILIEEGKQGKEDFTTLIDTARYNQSLLQKLDDLQTTINQIKSHESAISTLAGRANNLKAYQKDLLRDIQGCCGEYVKIWGILSPHQQEVLRRIQETNS